jgi:carbonic anhydrase
MSCSPANLTENITNSCDLKCKLVTDYPSQGITVAGLPGGPGLTALIINGISNLKIEYNFSEYTAVGVFFFKKSIHRYGGKTIPAEMIIMHKGIEGLMYICVPIVEGGSSSDLDDVFNNADNGNESSFDLNKFIPQKPYYSYTGGVTSLRKCPRQDEVIVFQKRHALTLLPKTIRKYITQNNGGGPRFNISKDHSISFSKNSPIKKEHDASFPITCEPYEDTEMEEAEKKRKFRSPFVMSDKDFKEWGSNVAVQIILGAVILYVLVKFLFLITNIGFKGGKGKGLVMTPSGTDILKTMMISDNRRRVLSNL